MTTVFAGLLVAGLLAPAHGEGIRVGIPVSRPTSLPFYPMPVISIGRPAIQLPSPALPVASLPSPVTVPVARLPEPVLPNIAARPDTYPVESPRRISGPVGPAQYPRSTPSEDPLPVGIPITVKSKIDLSKVQLTSGKLEAASASLKAVFDSAEKPAAPAVEAKKEEKTAQDKPVFVESERRVTLPEWDLENEIGINPVESTW